MELLAIPAILTAIGGSIFGAYKLTPKTK